jgi:hypothetical protein
MNVHIDKWSYIKDMMATSPLATKEDYESGKDIYAMRSSYQ